MLGEGTLAPFCSRARARARALAACRGQRARAQRCCLGRAPPDRVAASAPRICGRVQASGA
eukprot:9481696-Pyramimonas_sp.AAC.1